MSVGTESPGTEGEEGFTEGIAVFVEGKRWRISEVSLVTFVEGDDEVEVPVGLEEIVSHGIVGFVEGGHLDGIVQEVDSLMERQESGYRVVSSGIGEAEEEGELGGVF